MVHIQNPLYIYIYISCNFKAEEKSITLEEKALYPAYFFFFSSVACASATKTRERLSREHAYNHASIVLPFLSHHHHMVVRVPEFF